jgi:hypothetical protein
LIIGLLLFAVEYSFSPCSGSTASARPLRDSGNARTTVIARTVELADSNRQLQAKPKSAGASPLREMALTNDLLACGRHRGLSPMANTCWATKTTPR